jgi:hypothetical protein
MRQFEYKVLYLDKIDEDELNAFGNDGWEVISVLHKYSDDVENPYSPFEYKKFKAIIKREILKGK